MHLQLLLYWYGPPLTVPLTTGGDCFSGSGSQSALQEAAAAAAAAAAAHTLHSATVKNNRYIMYSKVYKKVEDIKKVTGSCWSQTAQDRDVWWSLQKVYVLQDVHRQKRWRRKRNGEKIISLEAEAH